MSDHDEALRTAADAGEPTELAVARVVRRAERTLDTSPVYHPPRRALIAAGMLLAAGIGAAVVARGSGVEAVALAADLPTPALVGEDVRLVYSGRGELGGEAARPRIHWESGELSVEVTPARGVDLAVETPEGTATVVGTGFTVNRDALGTHVSVRHGTVAVRCRDGREARLEADESLVCLPVRAAGMLARARALDAAGAEPREVLGALDAGLRLEPDGGPVRAELAARRIRTLVQLGREEEAASAAAAWLAGPETLRREEVRGIAIALALRRGDCRSATAYAEEAPTAPTLDPTVADALAACAQIP